MVRAACSAVPKRSRLASINACLAIWSAASGSGCWSSWNLTHLFTLPLPWLPAGNSQFHTCFGEGARGRRGTRCGEFGEGQWWWEGDKPQPPLAECSPLQPAGSPWIAGAAGCWIKSSFSRTFPFRPQPGCEQVGAAGRVNVCKHKQPNKQAGLLSVFTL